MMRSLFSGVAGLKTHQTKMDVIGNNIANVNTVAYKSQNVTFQELMYQTTQNASAANAATGRGGVNAKQIGLGVQTGAINANITTSGASQSTGNPFDIQIKGDSFFIVSDGANNYFTRAGAFYVDGAGNLAMTSNGYTVMGWQTDPNDNTNIIKDTVSALRIMSPENRTSAPEQTTKAYFSGIIDKNSTQLSSTEGVISNISVYDNLGYSYVVKTSIKTAKDGSGVPIEGLYEISPTQIVAKKDGKDVDLLRESAEAIAKADPEAYHTTDPASAAKSEITITLGGTDWSCRAWYEGEGTDPEKWTLKYEYYNPNDTDPQSTYLKYDTQTGEFQGYATTDEIADPNFKYSSKRILGLNIDGLDGFHETTPANQQDDEGNIIGGGNNVDIVLDTSTMFDNKGTSTIKAQAGDYKGNNAGRKVGEMSGVAIAQDGKITATYDNGTSKILGQIAVANFANPSGLEKKGDNLYVSTPNSGAFDGIGDDITSGSGAMSTGVLEMSNVDLSAEFTDMITTQRGFQANSRIITVSDSMLEELTNLKR